MLCDTHIEVWKDIPEYEGLYQVSDLGRVKSLGRLVKHVSGLQRVRERIRKLQPHTFGYLMLALHRNGRGVCRTVHSLVLEAFEGPCPKGMECRHLDGDPTNNTRRNLQWGTRQEQNVDRVVHGTSNRGARNGQSKLTESEVRKIRASKGTDKEIAKEFGVAGSQVTRIKSGKTWGHVQ